MPHAGGSKGSGAGRSKRRGGGGGGGVVQPGLESGQIGGLKNPEKMTPDAGDKPRPKKPIEGPPPSNA
jgi:hypothetical protein